MHPTVKAVVFWLVILLSAFLLWQTVKSSGTSSVPEISYSQFLSQVEAGSVSKVEISQQWITGTYRDGRGTFKTAGPPNQSALADQLREKGVEVWFQPDANNTWSAWLMNLAPLILLAVLWFFMIRRMKAGQRPAKPPGQDWQGGAGPMA